MAWWRLTAVEQAAAVACGQVTARDLVASVLERVAAVNPVVNAVVSHADAMAVAAAVDRGEVGGPLAGVPVTVKVNVDMAGFATTNGLRMQAGLVAEVDSPVVANLRRAGAVILGQTNTPAFSLRWFTRNGLHGATLNPLDPWVTPGGSSGGAGVAVATGMGAIGHGTDIAGSIRYPAYACGVHGLRPSLGRVPAFNATGGDRLIGGQLMAVGGPLARSMPDLRLALAVMAGRDMRDPWWQDMPLDGPAVARRVALVEAPDGMDVVPEVRAALHRAAGALADAGYDVQAVPGPPWREAMGLQLQLWMQEFRHTGLAGLRAEHDQDADFVYAQMCRHAPELDLASLMALLQSRARLTRVWRGFLAEYPVVLCPVSGELPFADGRDVASAEDFDAVLAAQMPMIVPPFMGLPGLTVGGVGVQLLADHFREDLLLAAGQVLAPEPIAAVTPLTRTALPRA